MRSFFRVLVLFQLFLGVFQIAVGIWILDWAGPLFSDPPFLGHGLERMYSSVSDLLVGNDAASKPLSTLHDVLFWLFARSREGASVGMIAVIILVLSGIAPFILAFIHWRVSNPSLREIDSSR